MAIASASQLSQLSVETAVEFEAYTPPQVKVLFSIDDVSIGSGGIYNNVEAFGYESLRFLVHSESLVSFNSPTITRLTMNVGSVVPAEFHLLYQLRIRTGDENGDQLKVVDKAVVEFVPGGRPITVEVTEERVRNVKFELRTINKIFLENPVLNTGDVTLTFADGKILRTWKGLLAFVSPYIAELVADPEVDCLEVGDFPSHEFAELLMQLHPTRRPLYSNFGMLSKAAVAFRMESIVYKLSQHLVDFNQRPMSFEVKCQAALHYQLMPALVELVTRAVQSGTWDRLIREGFDACSFFSPAVYKNVICPTVLSAKGLHVAPVAELRNNWQRPDYFKPSTHTVPLLFRGTRFHVNKGVLAVHGLDKFTVGVAGELLAHFSLDMQSCCALSEIIPGKMLISLLDSLHPGGPQVESKYLRAALIFCHDHGWTVAKENLEQSLLLEPATSSQHFLHQIRFAERYGLQNMIRNCIFRAESSCQEYATKLANQNFPGVSEETKYEILGRLCSGWALQPKYVNNLGIRRGTSFREREVRLNKGGARGFDDHVNEGTLVGLNSEYAFGPIEQLQVA